jgi:hypothetical protein
MMFIGIIITLNEAYACKYNMYVEAYQHAILKILGYK